MAQASQRPATVVTPWDRRESPPSLAQNYPEPQRKWEKNAGADLCEAGRRPEVGRGLFRQISPDPFLPSSHKIVDGDTLAALAERYLGLALRASEIYEANRNVLSNPRLLPIGAELKIPPRNRRSAPASSPSSGASPRRPLTPVPCLSK